MKTETTEFREIYLQAKECQVLPAATSGSERDKKQGLPPSLQKKLILLTTSFQTSGLQTLQE